jgi:hypothetical protein
MLDNMLFLARTDPASALRQRQELSAAEEVERIADYLKAWPAMQRSASMPREKV